MSCIESECMSGCCKLIKTKYKSVEYSVDDNWRESSGKIKKAGCFIYDPVQQKVLLVLSCDYMWGCPKGSVEEGETVIDCAIREVREETGLVVHPGMFLDSTVVFTKNLYYFVHLPETSKEEQRQHIESISHPNDVNGMVWVKVNCLQDLVHTGKIILNHNTKILLRRFLNLNI